MGPIKYTNVEGIELARHRDRISLFVESGRGRFEPETLALWRELQDPNRAAIDVGGYTGLFAIVAVKAGAGEVFTIEPNPKCIHRMRHNLRHNGVEEEVEVIEAAASIQAGEGKLEIGNERLALCSTSKLRSGKGTPVTTLDDIVQGLSTCRVAAVKIDVEGHEVGVLTGASELLEEDHPTLIIEVKSGSGGDREAEVTAILEVYGYRAQEGKLLDGRNRVYVWDESELTEATK